MLLVAAWYENQLGRWKIIQIQFAITFIEVLGPPFMFLNTSGIKKNIIQLVDENSVESVLTSIIFQTKTGCFAYRTLSKNTTTFIPSLFCLVGAKKRPVLLLSIVQHCLKL